MCEKWDLLAYSEYHPYIPGVVIDTPEQQWKAVFEEDLLCEAMKELVSRVGIEEVEEIGSQCRTDKEIKYSVWRELNLI